MRLTTNKLILPLLLLASSAFGQTTISPNQIRSGTIQRQHVNTTTTGKALTTKVVAGSGITLSSTGVDAGTGDVTISEAQPITGFGSGLTLTSGVLSLSGGGSGSVTSVGLSLPGTLFSVSGSPVTSSGTLAATLITQTANTILAGPTSGSPASPTFRSLVTADLPATAVTPGSYGDSTHIPTVVVDSTGRVTSASQTLAAGGGSGTVTSVGQTVPAFMSVSGSPVTTSGTLGLSFNSQSANNFLASPSGASGVPSFRGIVTADFPTTTVTAGSYGDSTHSPTVTFDATGRATAASSPAIAFPVTSVNTKTGAVSLTNTDIGSEPALGNPGSNGQVLSSTTAGVRSWITPAASGVTSFNTRTGAVTLSSGDVTTALGYTPGTGNGSVTSVSLALPAFLTVLGSPVTGSGTLTGTLATQATNTFFAAPVGSPGTPTFRGIAGADLPTTAVTPGTYGDSTHTPTVTIDATGRVTAASSTAIAGGSGTVTSVGLTGPGTLYTVSGSPITGSGTITETLNTQAANSVLAGPSSGGSVAPTFRSLVTADLPTTAVTPGSYTNTNLTVDATGRITAASTGTGGGGSIPGGGANQTLYYATSGTTVSSTSSLTNNGTNLGINQAPVSTVMLGVTPSAVGNKGVVITEASGQTANPLEIDNSGGTSLFSVAANGAMTVSGATYTTISNLQVPNGIVINPSTGGIRAATYGTMPITNIYGSINITGGGSQNAAVSSGSFPFLQDTPTIAQSGTAGFTGFQELLTEQTLGTGSHLLMDLQNNSNSAFKVTDGGGLTNYGYSTVNSVPTPAAPTGATAPTGGSLAASTTYYYRVSAVSGTGETLASTEMSQATAAGTATNTVTLTWTSVQGAESYNVYGRTAGAELKIASAVAGLTYTDTGSVTPSGGLPGSNTTGTISVGSSTGTSTINGVTLGNSFLTGGNITANNSLTSAGPATFRQGIGLGIQTVSTNTTLSNTHTATFVNAASGAITITLPTAVSSLYGGVYVIKKVDSSVNAVTINTTSSQTIDGSTTYSLPAQYNSVTVISDGTNWEIIAKI